MSKVLESAACGCKVVASKQPIPLGGIFEYEGAYQCAQRIREAMESSYHRSDYSCHRMEFRFAAIFEKVGVCAPLSAAQAG